MIEKAYVIQHIKDLSHIPQDANRIYCGSEYCIKAFPSNFSTFIKKIKEVYPLSLLTPPIIESELDLFYQYFNMFQSLASNNDEIIVNDFGTLEYLTKNKKGD